MMLPYLSFIFDLLFSVVNHLVGQSMIPSDVTHSTSTGTNFFYKFLLIIETTFDINNFLVYKLVMTNYFLSLNLIAI